MHQADLKYFAALAKKVKANYVEIRNDNRITTLTADGGKIGVVVEASSYQDEKIDAYMGIEKLEKIVKLLPEEEVKFELDEEKGHAVFSSHGSVCSVRCQSGTAPRIDLLETPVYRISGLKTALESLGFIIKNGKKDYKKFLIEPETLICTDTVRLGIHKIKSTGPRNFCLPATILPLTKYLTGSMAVQVDEDRVQFNLDNGLTIIMGQANSEFPTWRKIVPKNLCYSATMPMDALSKAIKSCVAAAKDNKKYQTTFQMGDKITARVEDWQTTITQEKIVEKILLSSFSTKIPVEETYGELQNCDSGITFNAFFIEEFLKANKKRASKVVFHGTSSIHPSLWTLDDSDDCTYLLMPINL